MSDYSGWMLSQIKIELRRRGAKSRFSPEVDSPEGRMIVKLKRSYDRFFRASACEPVK